jgi:hypothetical protein
MIVLVGNGEAMAAAVAFQLAREQELSPAGATHRSALSNLNLLTGFNCR